MDLAQEARALLESAHYRGSAAEERNMFYFEDESLFGFVWVADTVQELINEWQERQDDFLVRQADQLRESGQKSWNAYCVCLTAASADSDNRRELLVVEEDFRGARKIAAQTWTLLRSCGEPFSRCWLFKTLSSCSQSMLWGVCARN